MPLGEHPQQTGLLLVCALLFGASLLCRLGGSFLGPLLSSSPSLGLRSLLPGIAPQAAPSLLPLLQDLRPQPLQVSAQP